MTLRSLAGVVCIGLALAVGGCGDTQPTPEPPPRERVSAACIGLEVGQCELVLTALSEKLPGTAPAYVAISERLCDGPCPGSERGLWLGHVMVEFSDGRKAETILIEVDGDTIAWQPIESALVAVTPRSPRLSGPATEYTLGHCGIGSGIDVDGSFWNPVGVIDAGASDLINSAAARFTLNTADTATLVTEGGAVLQLVRHPGTKYFFLCD